MRLYYTVQMNKWSREEDPEAFLTDFVFRSKENEELTVEAHQVEVGRFDKNEPCIYKGRWKGVEINDDETSALAEKMIGAKLTDDFLGNSGHLVLLEFLYDDAKLKQHRLVYDFCENCFKEVKKNEMKIFVKNDCIDAILTNLEDVNVEIYNLDEEKGGEEIYYKAYEKAVDEAYKFKKVDYKTHYCEDEPLWIKTDDLQYCTQLEPKRFYLLGVNRLTGEHFPNGENFVCYRDEVNLNDYTVEEIQSCIKSYYKSLDEVYQTYQEKGDQIIAECMFEERMWMDCDDSFNVDTVEEAQEQLERWVNLGTSLFTE